MPSRYTATDAEAYQQLMGRWSPALARELIAWAGIRSGDRVLDLGCGTGSSHWSLQRGRSRRRLSASTSPPLT